MERWRVILDMILDPEVDDVPPHQWDWPDMIGLRKGEQIEKVEAMYGERLPDRRDN